MLVSLAFCYITVSVHGTRYFCLFNFSRFFVMKKFQTIVCSCWQKREKPKKIWFILVSQLVTNIDSRKNQKLNGTSEIRLVFRKNKTKNQTNKQRNKQTKNGVVLQNLLKIRKLYKSKISKTNYISVGISRQLVLMFEGLCKSKYAIFELIFIAF